jgi:hypothetical protein
VVEMVVQMVGPSGSKDMTMIEAKKSWCMSDWEERVCDLEKLANSTFFEAKEFLSVDSQRKNQRTSGMHNII